MVSDYYRFCIFFPYGCSPIPLVRAMTALPELDLSMAERGHKPSQGPLVEAWK
jgi:hypothetical protein